MTTYQHIMSKKIAPVTEMISRASGSPKLNQQTKILKDPEPQKSDRNLAERTLHKDKYQIVVGKTHSHSSSARETNFKQVIELPNPTENDQHVLMTQSNVPLNNLSMSSSVTPGESPLKDNHDLRGRLESNHNEYKKTSTMSIEEEMEIQDRQSSKRIETDKSIRAKQDQKSGHLRGMSQTEDSPRPEKRDSIALANFQTCKTQDMG
jgi:hypothetical protein